MQTSSKNTSALTTTVAPTEVIGFYPNKATRKLLATEWNTLPEEKKLVLKAARARRGIKCDICGSVGFYRENCPNGCTSPPSTPDSMASTPPESPRKEPDLEKESVSVGLFWGKELPSPKEQSFYQTKQKVDMSAVRSQSEHNKAILQESDANLGSFAFFKNADHAYARDYAELTLHQVMRRIVRLLESHLRENVSNLTASFDTTLLHPPAEKVGKTFYPDDVAKDKEYKEYFLKKSMKVGHKLKYKNQASLRPLDDLDCIFRGGTISDDHLYTVKPNAGESMHAKNTWKSVLARNDTMANSDPALVKKQEQLDKLFKDQSQWIANQQKSMIFRNDRFEHLVYILQSEIKKEHARDGKVLMSLSKKERKTALLEVWTERLASVDRLISILQSYKFSAGTEEADFLMYCLEQWKDISRQEVNAAMGTDNEGNITQPQPSKAKAGSSGAAKDLVAASTNPYYPDVQFLEKYMKKTARLYQMSKEGSVFTAEKHRELIATREKAKEEKLKQFESTRGSRPTSTGQSAERALPAISDIIMNAKDEAKSFEEEDAKRVAMIERYKLGNGSASAGNPTAAKKRRIHPREADANQIAKLKKSFRLAGLGTRIRKGNDTDPAHALPALIPIPKAFDGDSQIDSYAAQNIIFDLKKQMVLSDIGYTPQRMVPLYVRNSLEEKEGTSKHGDPCKEELAQDRRYSHYLGRPLVRFNPSVDTVDAWSSLSSTSRSKDVASIVEDPPKTSSEEIDDVNLDLAALSLTSKDKKHQAQKLDKKTRKELKKAQEEVRHLPITNSLVRLVFNNPEPTLSDLKYLDEVF